MPEELQPRMSFKRTRATWKSSGSVSPRGQDTVGKSKKHCDALKHWPGEGSRVKTGRGKGPSLRSSTASQPCLATQQFNNFIHSSAEFWFQNSSIRRDAKSKMEVKRRKTCKTSSELAGSAPSGLKTWRRVLKKTPGKCQLLSSLNRIPQQGSGIQGGNRRHSQAIRGAEWKKDFDKTE